MRSHETHAKAERCHLAQCPLAGKNDPRCKQCSGPVQYRNERGHKIGVARSCNKCPMNGRGLPVCFAACPGPNQSFACDGKSVETLGSVEAATGDQGVEAFLAQNMDRNAYAEARGRTADQITNASPEVEEAVLGLLRDVADMDAQTAVLFHSLLRGESMLQGAQRCGFTKQAASNRLQAFIRTHPHFAALHTRTGGKVSNRNGVTSYADAQPVERAVLKTDIAPPGTTKAERILKWNKYIIERPGEFHVVNKLDAAKITRCPVGWIPRIVRRKFEINGWRITRPINSKTCHNR